jgi:PST family polysaccharide transporter
VDPGLAVRLLRESSPEIAAGFSGLLFMRVDQIMLQHLAGSAAIGAFAVAVRLAEAWYFVPAAIVAATFPSVVAARAENPALYRMRLQRLMLVLCVLSYAVAALAGPIAEPLTGRLFGASFAAAAPAFAILVWGGLFTSLGLVSGSWIVAERRLRLNLWRNLVGLGANVLLNLLLVPRFGVTGAAFATLVALACAYLIFDLFVPAMAPIAACKWRALLVLPALRA